MRSRARHWSVAMASALVASALAALALGVFALSVGRTSADDVRIAVGELRARSAEARLVADHAAAGELTVALVRAQSRQLARAVSDLVSELADYAAKMPLDEAREAARLAPDVLALVEAVERASGDAAALSQLERSLGERVRALQTIERALDERAR
jgi:hypothetical protein